MKRNIRVWLAAIFPPAIVLTAAFLPAPASAQQMSIQYAEPIEIPTAGTIGFDAYGKRFAASLTDNERLLADLPAARKAQIASVRVLRGALEGQPGSWVRLTEYQGRVEGAIWDGSDLYAVTTHARIARWLNTPLSADPDQTVVYRVSDVMHLVPANFCATEPRVGAAGNGLAQYNAMVNAFKLQFVAVPTHQIDISLIADATKRQMYANDTEVNASMLARLNIVDGIFDSQVGLVVTASDIRLAGSSPDPFTSTDPSALLGQLRTFRAATPAVQSRAIAHLLTGRVLNDGGTLGIAHLSGACDANNGVSLTADPGDGNTMGTALTMAHEIAHNLSAEHDDAENCGANLLMWPTHSGSSTLSQCARTSITTFLANHASCLTTPQYADVTVEIDPVASPGAVYDEPFTWPVRIRSLSNLPIADAVVVLTLADSQTPTYVPSQGSCTPLNGSMRCTLGAIPAGAEARVELQFARATYGETRLTAVVSSANERYDNNNVDQATELTLRQASLAVTLTPTTRAAQSNEVVTHTFTVTASGLRTARDVQLNFSGYDAVTGVSSSQGTCNVISCDLGDIPSGGTATVTTHGYYVQAGSRRFGGTWESINAPYDGNAPSATVDVTATRDLAIVFANAAPVVTVGVPYEISFPIRVNGIQPINNGRFRFMSAGAVVEALSIDGVSCPVTDYAAAYGGGCVLGNMNPGDQRNVYIRIRFDAPMNTNVNLMAETDVDEKFDNNQYTLTFRALHGTDATIRSPVGSGGTEGSAFTARATVSSQGSQDAQNVVVSFEVPAGLRVDSATMPGATCALDGTRRVNCTRATLAQGTSLDMVASFSSDTPGQYVGAFGVTATNDGISTNNSSTIDIIVRPRVDVGIRPLAGPTALIVGQTREVTIEVFSGALRPARNVTVSLPYLADFGLVALTSTLGTCRIGVSGAPTTDCTIGEMPVNTTVRITARFTPMTSGHGMSGWVSVFASDDTDHTNNLQEFDLDVHQPGDVELRLASTTLSGTVGTTINLPRITLNTLTASEDTRLEFTLPAFAVIQTISSPAICMGTTQVQCYIGARPSGDSVSIDISVRLDAAGSFTSDLRVRAANDTNAANDTATLQIQSAAAGGGGSSSGGGGSSSSSSSGGGKGGGGGSFDWLALLLLAGFVATRRSYFRRALHDSVTRREPGVMSRRIR